MLPAGEKIDYSLSYLGMPIGLAQFTISDSTIVAKAKSSALSSITARFEYQYTINYVGTFLPLTSHKTAKQENLDEDKTFIWNHTQKTASMLEKNGTKKEYIIPFNTRDFFTGMFFFARTDSSSSYFDINGIVYRGELIFLKKETIKTALGKKSAQKCKIRFEKISLAQRTKSDMLTNNIVKEKNTLYIWFSGETPKIPLKIEFEQPLFNIHWSIKNYEEY